MNFLLTINDKFMLPAKLCIKSLVENYKKDSISTILINDTGLSEKNRAELARLHDTVRFISFADSSSSYTKRHTKDWLTSVKSKTVALRWCIEKNLLPVVMLDCDQFILHDFSHVLDADASCIVCKRKTPAIRPDKRVLNYIGSFFAAMDKHALEFVDQWINRISELENSKIVPPFETPALCEVTDALLGSYNLATIDDEIISAPNTYTEGKTLIFHYKSELSGDITGNIFLDRCNGFEVKLPVVFQKFLDDNLCIDDLRSIATSSQHSDRQEWEPPKFVIEKAINLDDLSIIFRSDKGPLKHNYTSTYSDIFQSMRQQELSLLEIGVANGSSLKMWASYFPKSEIYGVDIDENCKNLCATWEQIQIFIGDSRSLEFDRKFNIIIDDGSHVSKDIFDNLAHLWNNLVAGGFYIIEDTQCTFNIDQAKYYPFRKISDYRRIHFLRLVDLILWNLDRRGSDRAIEYVIAKPGLICIRKSSKENTLFELAPPKQLDMPSLRWLLKLRLKSLALWRKSKLKRKMSK